MLVLSALLIVVGLALGLRLSVTLHHWLPLGRDGPYHYFLSNYLLEHYPQMATQEVPGFFHFAAFLMGLFSSFGVSRFTAFDIVTALASGLVSLTSYIMMKRLTGDQKTALLAAFFSAFLTGNLRLMGELQKNALGVTLAPLSIFFYWRALKTGKWVDGVLSGISLGVVGLTHQLVFGTLVIGYISYLALLLAYWRRIPWREIRVTLLTGVLAALLCGWLYYGSFGGAGGLSEDSSAPPGESNIYFYYSEFTGRLLLFFALVGIGVGVFRRRKSDLFLIAWWLSAFIMAQPWVSADYEWRFAIMLGVPTAFLASVGVVEGMGFFCSERGLLGSKLGRGTRGKLLRKGIFAGLVAMILVFQGSAAYNYAWQGQMLHPLITLDEYYALKDFQENFGEVLVFGSGEDLGLYWPDAVGLRGVIQAGEIVQPLSSVLSSPDFSSEDLASEWYSRQQETGEPIYALVKVKDDRLAGSPNFVRIFEAREIIVYSLSENFTPSSSFSSSKQLHGETPPSSPESPPSEAGESVIIRLVLFPVYLTEGGLRFLLGVPLTVFIWVLVCSMGGEAIRRLFPSSRAKQIRFGAVVVFLFVGFLGIVGLPNVQPGGEGPRGEAPPPPGSPSTGPPMLLRAHTEDPEGKNWVRDNLVIVDRASVPDLLFDGENIRLYYARWDGGLGLMMSRDGENWDELEVKIEGLPKGHGAVDPDVVRLPDGRYRLYYYEPSSVFGDPALLSGPHTIASAISSDGVTFTREDGDRYTAEGITDPDVLVMNGTWRMFLTRVEGSVISVVSYDNGVHFSFERELPINGVATCTVQVLGGYRMYYHRGDPPQIYSAFSPDGENWVEEGVVLQPGDPGSLDGKGVETPAVLNLQTGGYLMVYQSRYS